MAIVMRMEAPGATAEQYEALNEAIGLDDENAPDGLVIHMAGVTDEGMVVIDVWESEEKLNTFFDDTLGPALADSEIEPGPPSVSKLHNMIPQGGGSEHNVIVEISVDAGPDVYDDMVGKMPSHAGDDSAHPVSVHIAGVNEDGSMFIADLWESAEAFASFAESEVVPAADERVGQIEPKLTPVHNVIRGKSTVSA
jgi:heme-degrading monooxygenase HmoA